ncbi:unnamed protein product [Aphanomyces euteiches]|nr:hypothetical protein AeMF1_011355 [Aphanomyces euteiches]KAH9130804.1 hypothetical protein LEN26_008183 [Aphanomyces euteiches]KAH9133167.1 hypothetical protein AeRB84_020721 [Aphanomyces euteiches]KAH9188443.1 hypothetical protein AeNC1_009583 [Aphanomyces euteiches]
MADPRPISDRNYMANSIRLLIEFLTDRHYDHALSHQLLTKPMKKDFVNIMQFLFRELDPNFEFSPKIEEDVANCYRTLKYPFPISKTALAAVGSPHSWPPLLAAISWIVELLSYDSIVQEESADSVEKGEDNGEKEMFDYLSDAYKAFLCGYDDEYDSMTLKMEEKLDAQSHEIRQVTEEIDRENDDLKRQIRELENAQSLSALNAKKRDYIQDHEKLKGLVDRYEGANVKLEESIQTFGQKLAQQHADYQEHKAKISQLQHRIDTQELSSSDLERMQGERSRLQELLQSLEGRYKALQDSHWKQETEISQAMDQVEELVNSYRIACIRLKLDEKQANGVEYAIQIDAHSGGAQAASALMNHLKKTIVPALLEYRRQRIERLDRVLDKAVEAKVKIGQATSEMNDAIKAQRDIVAQEHKLEESIRREQEAMESALERKLKEIEEIEVDLERLKFEDDATSEIGRAEKLLREAKQAYTDMTEQYEREIESRLRFIQHAIGISISFKEHIAKLMTDAEVFVRQFE